MSDAGGPYLFDVGVIALAHTDTPVRDAALSYVRDAINGEIDAVVPYPALLGAHAVLTTYYGQVAMDEGVQTVVTIDDDFERFDAFDTEIVLSPDEFRELNRFLGD